MALKRRIPTRDAITLLSVILAASLICGAGLGWFVLRTKQTDGQTTASTPGSGPSQGEAPAQTAPGIFPGLRPPTTVPVPTATRASTPDPWINTTLASMTVEQKVGQLLAVGVESTEINPDTCSYLARVQPGAVIYRGQNVETPDQLRAFSLAIEQCVRDGSAALAAGDIPLIIAIDHEGETVNRFQSGATLFPSPWAIGATGDPMLAYEVARRAGLEIRYAGANMVLGPAVDILTNPDSAVIGLRSYGNDPELVSAFAGQAMRGYREAGLRMVLKHFPGHGAVAGDSHVDLPMDSSPAETVLASYLTPYHLLVGNEADVAVMTSHVAFPSLDASTAPSSLSSPVIALLRQTIGFDGVVMTDSLGMGAIANTAGLTQQEAALRAILAGSDMAMVLPALDAEAARRRLLEAYQAGELGAAALDQAVRRVLRLKAGLRDLPPAPAPDWQGNQQSAQQIGYEAVRLYRNAQGLVPISDEVETVFAITPAAIPGLDDALVAGLAGRELALTLRNYEYNIENSAAYARSLAAQSASFDLVIVFTRDAHHRALWNGDDWQTILINELLAANRPLIVVALKSPADLVEFPDVETYIATYGSTPGQIQGVVDGLLGIRPLPLIPFEFDLSE